MEKIERMNTHFKEKVRNEYNDFIEGLKQLPSLEVITKAYEINFKEEIMTSIVNRYFTYEEAKALNKLKNPLDEFYQAWLKRDESYLEPLECAIEDKIEKTVNKMRTIDYSR